MEQIEQILAQQETTQKMTLEQNEMNQIILKQVMTLLLWMKKEIGEILMQSKAAQQIWAAMQQQLSEHLLSQRPECKGRAVERRLK